MGNHLIEGCRGGWKKYGNNPVLGGEYGTCFDLSVIQDKGVYKMHFSWRPKKSIGYSESRDGFSWSAPEICLGPRDTEPGWEDELNRPAVVKKGGEYHMWYTGQYKAGEPDGTSHIFYAMSRDGRNFTRVSEKPVLFPEAAWEKSAVMCPDVMWDEEEQKFKMWYSAGEQYEPNAIGYAWSTDGIHWEKYGGNPMFYADPDNLWEQHKAAGCHVIKETDWYYMFYIGYCNEDYAQIGIARSKDGISGWERHPLNPIIAPDSDGWDAEACYKPYAIYDGEKWLLWYNGRKGCLEQIGVVTHAGHDLGFDKCGEGCTENE